MKIMDKKDIKPRVYDFFDGIIPKGCITLLAGQGGSGKTTLACYLADSISYNAKVLFIECEESEHFISARLSPESKVKIAMLEENELQYTTEQVLKVLPEFDIIFIDSLRSLAGGKDINKASVAEQFLLPFIKATKGSEKSIVFLAHTNKGSQDSLQDMISGSERLSSGVRHCKIVINDKLSGRRFLTIAKDNTNCDPSDFEIISNEKTFEDQSGSIWVVSRLHKTLVDIEEIIIRNSRKFKEDLVRKKLSLENQNKREEIIPKSIREVLLASSGEPVDSTFISLHSKIISWGDALRRTGEIWVTKTRDGRRVTYHWTEKALNWLKENQ